MRRLRFVSLAVILALCLSIALLPSQTAIAGPGDYDVPSSLYPKIQTAINAASAAAGGGTVNVAAGNYAENIEMLDNVIIQGSGANVTFIDGGGSGSVVKANNVSNAKLDGFTITSGNATISVGGAGGGISLQYNSSANISNCIITGNSADYYGGGIFVHNSSPIISNCLITGNTAGSLGGGIFVFSSSPTVTNCTLTGNSATDGGGVYNWSSNPTITNCISANNTALNDGGGIYVVNSPSANITHNDFWQNSPDDYSGYSPGSDDISGDPLFVNPGGGDYRLQSGSPCIDAGNNNAPGILEFDLDGNDRVADGNSDDEAVVDMGAYEAPAIDTITGVEIDIKPGSDTNSVNPESKGVIPVAILTTADFDAATVNVTTVSFGPGEASPVHYALEDVDGDGIDMILHFKTQETGITAGVTEATLTGKTTDGKDIVGTDSVETVPPKGKVKKGSNSNSGQGNGRGSGNGNSNSGQGNGQGNGNDNSNSGQGNGQGNGNDNSNSGQGNGQGNGNDNPNPGQGNGKGRDK